MKGQTLVEAVIALGVAVVVMTAITTAVLTSLNNSQYSKLQNQATQLAQGGMEIMQSYRDAKSLSLIGAGTSWCLPIGCNPISGACSGTPPNSCPADGVFTRIVSFTTDLACNNSATNKLVTVDVGWSDGKCNGGVNCHHAKISACMQDTLRSSL